MITVACPICHRQAILPCECQKPLEDGHILRLLSAMVDDIQIWIDTHQGQGRIAQSIDSTCVAITAYMYGKEAK